MSLLKSAPYQQGRRIGSFWEKVNLVIVTVLNFILGNLLNSLMGTGEDDDTEDGQEDSSPIELDWMWLSLGAV